MSNLLRTALVACLGVLLALPAAAQPADDSEAIAHGLYLVNLLGCGRCHTEGYLVGDKAEGPLLAGSLTGMAYTAHSIDEDNPGVVFPGNLTGDVETGLGAWSVEEIIAAMTRGIARSGHERLLIMPWVNYNALTGEDMQAIAVFLKSLPPVQRSIPEPVPEGEPSRHPYVRYGVYTFTPHTRLDENAEPEPR